MKLVWIRHGETPGNAKKRYIGTTDESLSKEGRNKIRKNVGCYPQFSHASYYVSPRMRCMETLELIYPNTSYQIVEGLKECDFGDFENKNYMELKSHPSYQNWVDSMGTLPFPNGESLESFQARCVKAFFETMASCETDVAIFVVHGGTIMAIMSFFCQERENYYDWAVTNGGGFVVEFCRKSRVMTVLEEIGE